jgi:hypothetical protein
VFAVVQMGAAVGASVLTFGAAAVIAVKRENKQALEEIQVNCELKKHR